MNENILVFCGHPDDELIGCGASIAEYAKQGKNVISIIFSSGELSHLKDEIIKKKRMRESEKVSRYIGSKDVIFLGLPDSKIKQAIKENNTKERIKELIKQYKPMKIFTHNPSDPLPDHRAVYNIVYDSLKELKKNIVLYGFDIWNLYNLKERDKPIYYVDVSETFWKKIQALRLFKSQIHIMLYFLPVIFIRAKFAGRKNHCKYAERFFRLL